MTKKFTLVLIFSNLICGCFNSEARSVIEGGRSFGKEPASSMKVADIPVTREKAAAPLRESSTTEVITEAEGKEVLYQKYCVGTFGFYEEAFAYEGEYATSVVWGDNDEAYFYNILGRANYPSYVKGKVLENEVTLSVPQTVYYNADYGYGINLVVLKAHDYKDEYGRDAVEYLPDYSISTVKYTVSDNGVLNLVCPGEPFNGETLPDYAIGYVYSDNDEWFGYCDFLQELTPFDGEIVKVPEGLETKEYAFIYAGYGITVEVAFDDEYLYIRGFNPNFLDGTFKARLDGDFAYVKQNQIMGIYENCFMYTKCVYDNPDFDYEDDYSPEFIFAPEDVDFVFEISEDRNVISSVSKEMYLCLNGSATRLYYLAAYRDFSLRYQESYAGVPSNPSEPYWFDDFISSGTGSFFFNVPDQSVEQTLLDNDYLFYRIYVDGEIKVFQQEENPSGRPNRYFYPGIFEPTTLIPYNFTNWQDIYVYADTPRRMVDIYESGVTTVGVQVVYDYQDMVTTSDILTYNVKDGTTTLTPGSEAGVSEVGSSVSRGAVYNLQGVKILDNPSSEEINSLPAGIYIIDGKKVRVR